MQTDAILELLLQEAKKSNDTLGLIKEAILKQAQNRPGGNPGGNPPPTPPPPGGGSGAKPSEIFNVLRDSLSSLSPLIGSSADASTAVSSLGAASSTVLGAFKSIPGPVGAVAQGLDMMVKAAVAVYDYMHQQLKMYQDLNAAGASLTDGIFGFRKSSGAALLSMNDLAKVVTNNSDTFAAMSEQYGDGIGHFSDLVNSLSMAQSELGAYGLSQQQLADITAKNYKIQKMYSTEANFRDQNELQSSQNYVKSLVTMSKVLGVSVDQIMKKNEEFSKGFKSFSMSTALENLLPKKDAEEVTKSFGLVTSSLGEGGKVIQDVMSEFLSTGKLPDDIGQYGSAIMPLFDTLKTMAESGEAKDPKKLTKVIKDMLNSSETTYRMGLDIDSAMKTGNHQGAALLAAMRGTGKMMNDQANYVPGAFETLQTRLENWIGDSVMKPITTFFSDTANSIAEDFLAIYEDSGSLLTATIGVLSDGMGKLLSFIWSIPARAVAALTGGEYDSSAESAIADMLSNIFGGILMIGKFIRDLFVGSTDDVKKDVQIIKNSYKEFIDRIKALFTKLSDFVKNFTWDGAKDKMKDAAKGVGDAIADKWNAVWDSDSKDKDSKAKDKPKDKPKADEKKEQPKEPAKPKANEKKEKPKEVKEKPKPKSKPELTKPPALDKKDDQNNQAEPPVVPPTQAESDIINILNKLQAGTAESIALLNAISKYLQTISTNTEPKTNV